MKNSQRKQRFKKLVDQFKIQSPRFKAFYLFMAGLVIAIMIVGFLKHEYENVFVCILTLFLFSMPLYIERTVRITMPDTLIFVILLFIFAAEILGEMNAFYIHIRWWDTMLHTLNGFLCGAVGFSMVDILNKSDSVALKMSPIFVAIFAFCFSMTIGVLWEFFEFSMDQLFLTDMQKDTVVNAFGTVLLDPTNTNTAVKVENISSLMINGQLIPVNGYIDIGIIDTMKDLFVNFIGAIVFSTFGYFYLKDGDKWTFIRKFIPKRMTPEESEYLFGPDDSPEAEQKASQAHTIAAEAETPIIKSKINLPMILKENGDKQNGGPKTE